MSGFASQGAKRRGRTRSVAMIHRMTETEPQGFRQHNLSSTRTNVRFLSSLGRLVLSSMLDAKERGRSAPERTIIPFSESRYRSSDVGRALTDGRSPSFISAPSGRDYSSLYFASQSRSASTAFVRTKCGTHVRWGHPIPRYTHEGQCV